MDKLNNEWVEQLKSKCDIVSTISKYLRMEKKGKNYWACCPFHHEKTPSFCVNEYEQFFHCFGCKEGGDVIKFIQMYDSCDFMTAVSKLAESVGMELPQFDESEEIAKQKQEKTTASQILKLTHEHYINNLKQTPNNPALAYLQKRKIKPEFIEKFKIGYSKDWTSLVYELTKKGFSKEAMKKAGVVDEKDGKCFDSMAGRLVFPIIDTNEQCLGFSARNLVNNDFAKYKNTAQTLLFNKSKMMIGMNLLKSLKQRQSIKYILVVEGQIDVITMHQNGFDSAVACMGTALTKEHARELKRFSENIVLCFDGDEAGKKATLNSIEILSEYDFNIKVVSLPDKCDPDEFINQNGKEEMQKLIDKAKPVIDYLLFYEASKYDMSQPQQRSKYVSTAISILNQRLSSFSEKQVYLETIRKYSNVPVDVLMRDLTMNKVSNAPKKEENQAIFEDRENASVKAMKFVLASLLFKKDYVNFNYDYKKFIKNPSYVKLYDLIVEFKNSGKTITVSDVYSNIDVDNEPVLKDIIYYNFDEIGNNAKQYFDACVWNFYENYLKQEQERLNAEFRSVSDVERRRQIALRLSQIVKLLKNKKVEEI